MNSINLHSKPYSALSAYLLATALAFGFITGAGVRVQAQAWSYVASMHNARAYAGAATGPDGRVYAIGGIDYTTETVLSSVEAYNPATNTWTVVAPLNTVSSHLAAVTGPDGRIYAIGGGGDHSPALSSVEAYDTSADTWTYVAPMSAVRSLHAAAVGPDGRIYAIGGFDGTEALSTVEAYDLKTNLWVTVAPMHTARAGLAAAVGSDGRIYAMGGDDLTENLSSTEAYNVYTDTWTFVKSMNSVRTGLAATTGPDVRIYALGGATNLAANSVSGELSSVEAYNTSTNTWANVTEMNSARYGVTAATGHDGRIYAIGGAQDNYNITLSSVEAYSGAIGTPTANAQTFVVSHNTVGDITLKGTDPDVPALALAFTIVAKPANGTLGTLNKTTGAITYTPKASYQGTDTFTFSVSNGTNTSAAATVTLKVASGVPTGNAQTVAVAHSTAIKITLTGSDPDVPVLPLTFELATIPAHGVLGALNASTGVVTYTPDSNYDGTDSFTFTVDNGTNTSVPAKVTLNVAAGTPTANAQTVAVAHGTAKSITLTGTDPDSPALPLTFAIVGKPAHGVLGTLNATTGVVEYTPTSTYSGTDSFTFTAGNKTNISAAATVTLNVAAGTPKANAQTVAVAHNTATSITLTGTDPDVPALALTYAIVAKPTNGTLGTLDKATGAVTYTPKASFQGTDTFTFTVNNGTNTSAAATVTLKVAPGTPTANAQTVTVVLNTAIKITLTGTDPDVPALPLTFAIVTKPLHGVLGSVNASTGVVTYTPDSKYDGTDTFTFTVSNGTNKSAAATVTLKVGGG